MSLSSVIISNRQKSNIVRIAFQGQRRDPRGARKMTQPGGLEIFAKASMRLLCRNITGPTLSLPIFHAPQQ